MRIAVEGNIGAGKSSLLAKAVHAYPICPEPVEAWGDLLEKYYADPPTWSLPFNLRVLADFARVPSTCIVERSPGATRHVFTQLAFNDGLMTDAAFSIFKEYYARLAWTPDVIIYIDTPSDICFERVRQRGRPGEEGVSLDYLRKVSFLYDQYLKYAGCEVIRIDGTWNTEALFQHILQRFQ